MDKDIAAYRAYAAQNGVAGQNAAFTRQLLATSKNPTVKQSNGWLDYLPTITGTIGGIGGAALGTLLPTGATTVAGGVAGAGAGSAFGKWLEGKITGQETTTGDIVNEGLWGAGSQLAGGALGKVAGAGIKTLIGGKAALTGGKAAASAVANSSKGANLLTGLTDNVGDSLVSGSRGISAGQKVAGQARLGVQDAEELNAFLTQQGIKVGSAASQLKQVENLRSQAGKLIGDTINASNIKLANPSLNAITDTAKKRLLETAGVPKAAGATTLLDAAGRPAATLGASIDHPLATQLIDDLSKVTDLKGLKKFQESVDDIINYSRNAQSPDPVRETIAKAFRSAASDQIGDLVPSLKVAQTQYGNALKAEEFLKMAAKDPKGIQMLGNNLLGDEIQALSGIAGSATKGIGSKVARGIGNRADAAAEAYQAAGNSKIAQFANKELLGTEGSGSITPLKTAGRATLMDFFSQRNNDDQIQASQDTESQRLDQIIAQLDPEGYAELQGSTDPGISNSGPSEASLSVPTGIVGDEAIAGLLQQALSAPDAKSQAALLANIKSIQDINGALSSASGTKTKPLSAEASKQVANAQSGIDALGQLGSILSKDTNAPLKDAAGSLGGNLGRSLTGTQGYETARQEVVDVLARLRTGAAITTTEEQRFLKQLPQPFDSPETIKQKLTLYNNLFNRILAGQAQGSPDIEIAGGSLK